MNDTPAPGRGTPGDDDRPDGTPSPRTPGGGGGGPEGTGSGPEPEPGPAAPREPDGKPSEEPSGKPSGTGAEQPPGATGRAALLAGLWPPRVTRAQLVAGGLLFILGLGLAMQIQSVGDDGALRGARPEDLVRTLSDLDERTKRLDEERTMLERQRSELESSSDQAEEARRQNRERELQLGVLAGTVAASGPGIEIVVTDPLEAVGADRLLDAVQELRAAGAEAMQINGVRVVASTSFVDSDTEVRIDGEAVSRPFRIQVIGSPQDLEPALKIPGGVVQSLEKESATVTINRPDEVTVGALRSAERPDYAQSSS